MGRLPVNERDYLQEYPQELAFMRKLADFWKPGVGLQYLAYGQLLRPLRFDKPRPMPTAPYAPDLRTIVRKDPGQAFEAATLQSGVFQGDGGGIGIFIVNVSEKPLRAAFAMTPDRYPIQPLTTYVTARVFGTGARRKIDCQKGRIAFDAEIAGHDVVFLEAKASAGEP